MFDSLFKTKKDSKQLGKTLVAIEIKKGKVPAHCDGLILHDDGSFDRYSAGDELKASEGKRLLLIHKGPYIIQYSPNDQAPEMGLEVSLQVEFESELSLFLSAWDKPVLSVDDLTQKAKQVAGQYILQPGMTQQEIDRSGGILARYSMMMQAYGFRCRKMQRKDLKNQVNTAELLWKDLTTEQIVAKQENQQEHALEIELGSLPSTNKVTTPFFRVNQFDQKLTRTLQRELVYINKKIQQFSMNDADHVNLMVKLQQHIQRCQSHSQMLPPLNSSIAALKLTKSQQRQSLKPLQHATHYLKNIKISLSNIQHTAVSDNELNQLIALSSHLEAALKQRAARES